MDARNQDVFVKSKGYNPELRDKFIQMPINEKRKLYKCGKNFITLDGISSMKTYKVQSSNSAKSANVPVLSNKEATIFSDQISIWQGDITKLEIDAIVNAANETLLGGGGVDGAIHSAAGPMLVSECRTLHGCQGGKAKISCGYNLPAKYVIHTVGPRNKSEAVLRDCYKSCLNLMQSNRLTSIAFPCIATGIFGYPNEAAAKVAIDTVMNFLRSDYGPEVKRIIFTVFLEKDLEIYESLLSTYLQSLYGQLGI